MAQTTIKIKTYACLECGYKQDFDHEDAELMAVHFPGVPVGSCPSCHGQNPDGTVKMERETRPEHVMEMTGDQKDLRNHVNRDDTADSPS